MTKQTFTTYFFMTLLCVMVETLNAQTTTSYEVFIASYSQPVPKDYFKGLSVTEKYSLGQFYNYYLTGNFSSKDAAEKSKNEALQKGFKDARVEDVLERVKGCCAGAPPSNIEELRKLRNIFFDFDKSSLRAESVQQLQSLVRIMKANPSYTVEVHANTDAKGDLTYNEALAGKRRDAAMNYLTRQGISKDRISGVIHGETNPIAKNEIGSVDSPEGRQFNRRIELIVKDGNQILNVVEEIQVPENLRQ